MEGSDSRLASKLALLANLTIFELRGEWRRHHRMPPPKRLSRDLLIRGIAYKIQERALGGLSRSTLRKLESLRSQNATAPWRTVAVAPSWNEAHSGLGRDDAHGHRAEIRL